MKKILFIVLSLIFVIALAGCGERDKNPASAPEGAATPTGDPGGIIITTKEPTAVPTPTPTPKPDAGVEYIDIVKDNEYVWFSASSIESEGTDQARGPEFCFDEIYDDINNRWSSVFYDVEGAYIQVDFGYPVVIDGIYLYECTNWNYTNEWEAQYLDEEKNEWVTIYDDFGFENDLYYEFDENTPEIYSFRIVSLAGTGIAVSWYEIVIKGLFVEVPEGTEPRVPKQEGSENDFIVPEGVSKLSSPDWEYKASSMESENLAAQYAFDGKTETRWGSAFGGLPDATLGVDFKVETTIKGLRVIEVKSWGYTTAYSIQIMKDGQWFTAYEGQGFDDNEYIALSAPAATTQIQIVLHTHTNELNVATIGEVILYG